MNCTMMRQTDKSMQYNFSEVKETQKHTSGIHHSQAPPQSIPLMLWLGK